MVRNPGSTPIRFELVVGGLSPALELVNDIHAVGRRQIHPLRDFVHRSITALAETRLGVNHADVNARRIDADRLSHETGLVPFMLSM